MAKKHDLAMLALCSLLFLALCRSQPLAAAPAARFLWSALGSEADPMKDTIAVRVAPDGTVWVADASSRFFIFDSLGRFLETWGEEGSGPGQFLFYYKGSGPGTYSASIAFRPDGSFYVVDSMNNRIQRFDQDRRYLGEWGKESGPGMSPVGILLTADGDVLVSYLSCPDLYLFDAAGAYKATLKLGLDMPGGMAIDERGRLYVVEMSKKRVRIFDAGGMEVGVLGSGGPSYGGFKYPSDIVFDARGYSYVADQKNNRVVVFDPRGSYAFAWGERGNGDGQFLYTSSAIIDGEGNAYVCDWMGRRVEKFAISGL